MAVKSIGFPAIINDKAFSGTGESIYVNTGTTVKHRRIRVSNRKAIRTDASLPTRLTLRNKKVTSGTSTTVNIASLVPGSGTQQIAVDVRPYASNIELITDQNGIRVITINSSGDGTDTIQGTATIISKTKYAGGIVRVKFRYTPSAQGVQPISFRLTRTAGPSSPTSTSVFYVSGQGLYEISTNILLDSSAYTFKLEGVRNSITKDLVTGISITADATAPSAPAITGKVV
jgi:hypothetical protein